MICRNGHPAEPSDRRCPTCGAPIEADQAAIECPNGHSSPPTNSFCGSCGEPLTDDIGVEPLVALTKDQRTESFWEGEGFRASEGFWDSESFWDRLRKKKRRPTKVGLPDS